MKSIWDPELRLNGEKTLSRDRNTEVAVVGAGLAGILTAYFLQKKGFEVIVLEANTIGSGVTSHTTAKIAGSIPNFYAPLREKLGEESAFYYAEAMMQAVNRYEKLIQEEKIDCEFERVPSYIYSQENTERLMQEYQVLKQLGQPVQWLSKGEAMEALPFAVKALLAFPDQGQVHPIKLINGLADKLEVFEHTQVEKIEGNRLITLKADVTAKYIVIASHYPMMRWSGHYYARLYQSGSKVVAFEQAKKLPGMYIAEQSNGYSLRNYQNALLVGTVESRCMDGLFEHSYETITQAVHNWYPTAVESARWSAQDCMSMDQLPFIGQEKGHSSRYVITGFHKWGFAGAMLGAELISDLIQKKKHPLVSILTPKRSMAGSLFGFSTPEAKEFHKHIGITIRSMNRHLKLAVASTAENLHPGEGGVLKENGDKIGIYKDDCGQLWTVSLTCPHLGCQLVWNSEDRTWDCPCHGSRFDYHGSVINNPAPKGLK